MNANTNQTANTIRAVLTLGFLAAVLMWCAWFLTHLPGYNAPPAFAGVLLIVIMAAVLTQAGRVAPRRPWLLGLLAGLTCGLINLLVLGSLLVEQPTATGDTAAAAAEIRPDAYILVPGFLLLCSVLGAIDAAVGARVGGPGGVGRQRDWLAAFAWVAVIATIPVLLIGGIVTSAEAGLAVPDWPGTYGFNMFLYPIALMADPRVFLEHSHRLFGALVGLTTLVLTIQTIASGRSRWMKLSAAGLLVLVIVQGVMGGQGRVVGQSPYYGALHGIVAQIFFALMVAFAAGLSAGEREDRSKVAAFGRAGPLTALLLGAVLLQLVLGAMFRHLDAADPPITAAGHALMSHAVFAFVVLGLAAFTGFSLRGRAGERERIPLARRRVGNALVHTVGLQFILGWAALLVTTSRGAPPTADELAQAAPVPLYETLITMAHQANGALVLALATLAFGLWISSWRRVPVT